MGAAAAALCACASLEPAQTAQKLIGSPESTVRQAFGAPTETYRLDGGTSRESVAGGCACLRPPRRALPIIARCLRCVKWK